ncbi:MAG: V-type ATP synthase subunit E [Treponema sp.]|jgi:V/A-type H+-transporting ATPase subunit E|nr:V-type ATP synthase subunit E [Treponema sp.]
MDIQLHELIDKIKKDGIESASEEASRLKAQAEAEAKRVVDAAKKEAEAILARAKADAERTEKAGVAAVGQASRNLVLEFRAKIQGLLDAIVVKEVSAAFDGDALKKLLPEIIKNWAAKGDDLAVLLSEGDLRGLESSLKEKLSAELKKGVEFKSDRGLQAGFRIAGKDGAAYYDFSAAAVAELLSAYLNPRLAETLKNAVKEG